MNETEERLVKTINSYFPQVAGYYQYEGKDLAKTKSFLRPFLSHFKGIEKQLLAEVFTCLKRAIIDTKERLNQDFPTPDKFIEKGKAWQQYGKMILEMNRAIQSMAYGEHAPKDSRLFHVKKIIFEGENKVKKGSKMQIQKIELEGHILELIKDIFSPFYDFDTDEEKMKAFSKSYHNAFQEFTIQMRLSQAEEGTLAKQRERILNETNIETAFNKFKHKMAYSISQFIKKHSSQTSKAKNPTYISTFIAEYFHFIGLEIFEKEEGIKKYSNFIDWGNPNRIS